MAPPTNVRHVRVPARVDAAVRALLAIADGDGQRVTGEDIAKAEGLSRRFLSSVLTDVGTAGLVESARGTGGGYRLAQPAEDINLWRVYEVADRRPALAVRGGGPSAALWCSIEGEVRTYLESVSLSELGRRRCRTG